MSAMRRKEPATADLIYCSASTAKLAASLLKMKVDWPVTWRCSVYRIGDPLLMKIDFLEVTLSERGEAFPYDGI